MHDDLEEVALILRESADDRDVAARLSMRGYTRADLDARRTVLPFRSSRDATLLDAWSSPAGVLVGFCRELEPNVQYLALIGEGVAPAEEATDLHNEQVVPTLHPTQIAERAAKAALLGEDEVVRRCIRALTIAEPMFSHRVFAVCVMATRVRSPRVRLEVLSAVAVLGWPEWQPVLDFMAKHDSDAAVRAAAAAIRLAP